MTDGISGMSKRTPRRGTLRPAVSGMLRACLLLSCAFSRAYAQQGPQAVLEPAGTQARHIGGLWWLFFYVLSAVWVLVMIATLLSVFYGRRNREESGPRAVEGEPPLPEVLPDPASERRKTLWVGASLG